MLVDETGLDGVLVLTPDVYPDERGHFFESWNQSTFNVVAGTDVRFVQDNQSLSKPGVLRGIHYQMPNPQGKLVRVISGAVWDVAVDLRRSSSSFLQWVGMELSAENRRQLWIPEGFGHGFVALGGVSELAYKVTNHYSKPDDRVVRWDDPDLAIDWPIDNPLLSERDADAPLVRDAELYE